MTLFSRRVSAGQKRQPNNTVGAAAVHRWRTADRTMDARKNIEKSGSSLYARQPHLASTYGSKNSLTPPHSTSRWLVESLLPTRGSMRLIHFGPNIDLTVADGRLLSCEVDGRPLALLAHALNFTFLWCLFHRILFHVFHLPVKLVSESIVRCFC